MKFTKEPGFKHTVVEPRYFVLRLDETEPEYAAGYRFAIQFLNNRGEGGAELLFSGDDTDITLADYDLPTEVVIAARRQTTETGDYVNSNGESERLF